MAVTRLGWDVLTSSSSPRLTNFKWVTGKVRAGDAEVILDYFCQRYNAEVEPIIKAHSWGWSYRPVRGASIISEHAAGVAIDLNAPAHPLGTNPGKSFSSAQIAKIRQLVKDLRGSIRWGGDYAGRKDPMHFELQGGVKKLKEVADLIRAGKLAGAKPAPAKPAPKPNKDEWPNVPLKVNGDKTAEWDKAWRVLMPAVGYKDSNLGLALQKWLSDLTDPRTGKGYYNTDKFLLDGDFSAESVKALQRKLYDTKGDGGKPAHLYNGEADGDRGELTVIAEKKYLNLPANRGK